MSILLHRSPSHLARTCVVLAGCLGVTQPTTWVALKRRGVSASAGPVSVLTFDSDAFPSNSGFQGRMVAFGDCAQPQLNLFDFTYYVEVTLIKSGAGGAPGLGALRLCPACSFTP